MVAEWRLSQGRGPARPFFFGVRTTHLPIEGAPRHQARPACILEVSP